MPAGVFRQRLGGSTSQKEMALRKLFLFLLVALAGLTVPATAHAACWGDTDPITPGPTYHVCGTINWVGFNGSQYVQKPTGASYVKICPAGSTSSGCRTTMTTFHTDAYGQTVVAYKFYRYRAGSTGYSNFDFYAWSYDPSKYWGSSTKPIVRFSIGPYGVEGLGFSVPPAPLEPTPVYPVGSEVPSSYTVTWKSGINNDRKFPALYEVWFKYWPFGGEEPSSWSLSTDTLPCHADGSGPDANNECSTDVVDMLPGNWKWYMVAKLNVSQMTHFTNNWFSTNSGEVYFIQPQ
jgi:hypothetical protein